MLSQVQMFKKNMSQTLKNHKMDLKTKRLVLQFKRTLSLLSFQYVRGTLSWSSFSYVPEMLEGKDSHLIIYLQVIEYEEIYCEFAISFQDVATRSSYLAGSTSLLVKQWFGVCLILSLSFWILWNLDLSIAFRIDVISDFTANV